MFGVVNKSTYLLDMNKVYLAKYCTWINYEFVFFFWFLFLCFLWHVEFWEVEGFFCWWVLILGFWWGDEFVWNDVFGMRLVNCFVAKFWGFFVKYLYLCVHSLIDLSEPLRASPTLVRTIKPKWVIFSLYEP